MHKPTSPIFHNGLLNELCEILSRYIAVMTVRAVVGSALHKMNLNEAQVHAEHITRLVEEVMVGLRLFVEPKKLPDLMLELADFVGHHSGLRVDS